MPRISELLVFLCLIPSYTCRAAVDARKPVAIINVGPTRVDDMATLKIEARSGEVCVIDVE